MRTTLMAMMMLAATTGAQAEQSYDMAGTITGQSSAEIHQISEGHMMMGLPSTHAAFEMATPDHPFAEMTGTCTGMAEVKGGAASGAGMCAYVSPSGDKAFNRWTIIGLGADGSFQGQWIMVGGTGAMSGVTGGGGFVSMTDRENGAQTVTIDGAITLQ